MRRLHFIDMVLLLLCVMSSTFAATKKQTPTVYTAEKPAIQLSVDQAQFTIKLQSNPTTGYSWFLRTYDNNLIQPVSHRFQSPAQKKLIGAPGYEFWTFRMKKAAFVVPQQTALRFTYTRPWDGSGQSKQVVFTISTRE
jgi:inhibitor of cysteine peptidase